MKTLVTACPEPDVLAPPTAASRALDYLQLTKPRISVMVLFTVAAGALLAGGPTLDWVVLLHTVLGTGLVAAGASALNMLLERHSDARMRRTEGRPLPAGRLHPVEVLAFGSFLSLVGLLYLALALPTLWAAGVAGLTLVSYVFLYTPLKRCTTLNTLVGAVPGALPPVIGCVAVTGAPGGEALTLFLILFLWQVPHFLAIAWIYREDYARAGLHMLPVFDRDGRSTGLNMVAYCLVLLPVSLLPALLWSAGPVYLAGVLLLGLGFLACAGAFLQRRSARQARLVLRASLLYLPAVLALLLLDGISGPVLVALWP
jgi:protoheme IX farnesyltransferase